MNAEMMYAISAIGIMALVTLLIRALPFLAMGNRKTPGFMLFLSKYLPYAMIGMLVVYCLKDVTFLQANYGIPELASILLIVTLHVWRRNTLLSIIGGTICYMLLVQFL